MDQPRWMAEAWRLLGLKEAPGAADSKAVTELFRDAGRADVTKDEVAWCAAYVGACLERADIAATGSLLARSYLGWGTALDAPRLGAVTVLSRGRDPGAGHIGFWLGETERGLVLLGGNQSDRVGVDVFDKARLLGYRWPAGPTQAPGSSAATLLSFDVALVHVLEMEGGFTDDPDDPGGPTNKGITLDVFTRHTGAPLDAFTRAERIRELRAIADDLVREIYLQRYWRPSQAREMPPAIGFMHFDATVNHGVTGAARLLQEALKRQHPEILVDGEIGPLTLAAARAGDERRTLADYAEVRRARYRALPHFWKFGRGWLGRVDRTEARARTLIVPAPKPSSCSQPSPSQPSPSQPSMKGHDMTIDAETETTTVPGKWWGHSMTVWGALLTALSTVVPVLGPAVGLDLTPEVVRQAGEQAVNVIQALGGLMGTLMTIYGRSRATQGLVRRRLEVDL